VNTDDSKNTQETFSLPNFILARPHFWNETKLYKINAKRSKTFITLLFYFMFYARTA